MRRFIDESKPESLIVPECYADIEKDFLRILYVENRIKVLSSLPFDRLKLKERLLSSLEPPEIEDCFVKRNIELTRELLMLKDQLSILRSSSIKEEVVNPIFNSDTDPLIDIDPCEKDEPIILPVQHNWRLIGFCFVFIFVWMSYELLFGANLRSKVELVAPPMVRQPLKGGHPNVVNSTPSGEH